MSKELSSSMQELANAIRAHPNPVQVALCGFDLWLEVLGSGHAKAREFKAGGELATGDELPTDLKVPIMVIGDRIVISFDPTLPADGFQLKP